MVNDLIAENYRSSTIDWKTHLIAADRREETRQSPTIHTFTRANPALVTQYDSSQKPFTQGVRWSSSRHSTL